MDLWDPLLLDRLAQNRTVIAFDNKGVGLTNGIAPDNFAAMADDAADFIAALGYKRVDILGFSIGGAVAQELLIRHNELVRRAILAGTSAKGGEGVNQMSEKSKSVSTKPSLTDDDYLYGLFAPSARSQALGREYLQRVKRRTFDQDEPVSMATVRAQAIAREEWGTPQVKPDERLKAVANPVLISNGINDIRMPTINSYRLSQILPYSQLILYPDSGHGFLFQYPDVCGKAFADFLDQTLSGVSNTQGETEMMTAVQLLEQYTRRVSEGNFEKALELFSPDAVFEFPYFPSVGIGGHLVGIDAIRKQIGDFLTNQTEDFKFHNIQIFAAEDPNRAFGEYSVTTRIKATGRVYNQLYGGRLESKDGKIVLLREFSDPVAAAEAIFPNGLADIPVKTAK